MQRLPQCLELPRLAGKMRSRGDFGLKAVLLRQGYGGQAPLRQGYGGQAPLRQGYGGQALLARRLVPSLNRKKILGIGQFLTAFIDYLQCMILEKGPTLDQPPHI